MCVIIYTHMKHSVRPNYVCQRHIHVFFMCLEFLLCIKQQVPFYVQSFKNKNGLVFYSVRD